MRYKAVTAVALIGALIGTLALLGAAPAEAQRRESGIYGRGHTVFRSRDEDGRTRTRVIIQKRSYLDPGTETFPGERGDHDYAVLPNHRASGVVNNTAFGINQSALPGPFDLPFKSNPWIGY